jgi:hypothetical protein
MWHLQIIPQQGIDAEYVSLENIVPEGQDEGDSKGWDTDTLDQSFYNRLCVALGERISQCGNKVPVVTGAPYITPTAVRTSIHDTLCRFFWFCTWVTSPPGW